MCSWLSRHLVLCGREATKERARIGDKDDVCVDCYHGVARFDDGGEGAQLGRHDQPGPARWTVHPVSIRGSHMYARHAASHDDGTQTGRPTRTHVLSSPVCCASPAGCASRCSQCTTPAALGSPLRPGAAVVAAVLSWRWERNAEHLVQVLSRGINGAERYCRSVRASDGEGSVRGSGTRAERSTRHGIVGEHQAAREQTEATQRAEGVLCQLRKAAVRV